MNQPATETAPETTTPDTPTSLLDGVPETAADINTGGETPTPTPSTDDSPWNAALPDDLKENPTLSRFKSLEDVAKSYLEARSKLGSAVNIPGEDATPEELSEFYTKLGRPTQPAEYELNTPEGLELPEGTTDWFKNEVHSLGLSRTQAEALWSKWTEREEAVSTERKLQITREATEAKEALMREWGSAYNGNIGSSINVMTSVFNENVVEKINAAGLGRDPGFIKDLLALGKRFGEDSVAGTTGSGPVVTRDALVAEHKKLMGEPKYFEDPVIQSRVKEIFAELDALDKRAKA